MKPVIVATETLPTEGRTFEISLEQRRLQGMLDEAGRGDFSVTGTLVGKVVVRPTRGAFVASGRINCPVSYSCVRCLESFDASIEVELDTTFAFREEEIHSHHEVEADMVEPLVDNRIDLTNICLQYIILSADQHPLCSSGCKGLCPGCGSDLNRGGCECESNQVDPRFAVLQKVGKK